MGNAEGGLCKPSPAPREVLSGDPPLGICQARRAPPVTSGEREERTNEFDNDDDLAKLAIDSLADACTLPRRALPQSSADREDSNDVFPCAGDAQAFAADVDDFIKLNTREKQTGSMEVASLGDLQDGYISQWAIDVRTRGYDHNLRTNVVADSPTDMMVTQNKTGHCSLRSEKTVPLDERREVVYAADSGSTASAKEKKNKGRQRDPERTPESSSEKTDLSKTSGEERVETHYDVVDFSVPRWASSASNESSFEEELRSEASLQGGENDGRKILIDGRESLGPSRTDPDPVPLSFFD